MELEKQRGFSLTSHSRICHLPQRPNKSFLCVSHITILYHNVNNSSYKTSSSLHVHYWLYSNNIVVSSFGRTTSVVFHVSCASVSTVEHEATYQRYGYPQFTLLSNIPGAPTSRHLHKHIQRVDGQMSRQDFLVWMGLNSGHFTVVTSNSAFRNNIFQENIK